MLDAPGRSDLGWKLDDVLVAGWLGGGVVGRRSEFGQSLGCRHHRRPRSSRDLCAQRLGCCLSASRSLVLVSGLDCVVLCWSSVWGGAVGVGSEFEGQSLGHRQVTHSRGWCAQRLCCCLRVLVACDIQGLGWKVLPSQTNFLLAEPPGLPAKAWLERLREKKILVRWFSLPEIQQYLRITIGTDAEIDALLRAVRAVSRAG